MEQETQTTGPGGCDDGPQQSEPVNHFRQVKDPDNITAARKGAFRSMEEAMVGGRSVDAENFFNLYLRLLDMERNGGESG